MATAFARLDVQGVVRYPYPPIVRPGFLPRPGPVGAPGTVPSFARPPLLIRPPMVTPIVRPAIFPVIIPVEKPQTTVYVGKIAPSVENEFIRSLLELCGPIKSWKRAQDPSDGTPRRFGFCEFESAEGVLRALRLLSKCKVDGEELSLNVNQATRDYLERYVAKKKVQLSKQSEPPSETETEEAKKEGESASEVEKGDDDENKESEKPAENEPKKDANGTENKENDGVNFGLVGDDDRNADRDASEKLTNMIEERIKNRPLPPPPPPPQRVAELAGNSNSEVPSKSGDKDSDIDTVKTDEKNDDELTSETKSGNRAGTVSPDRSRRNENRGRDRERERDRDRREKERELDRLERDRERDRQRRERDREVEVQKAERFYKERLKEWEVREKDREYKRKYEREKEKERDRERRRLIADQEDESDDDSRKRRRKSDVEEKRRRRRREKEEDLADRLKEDEEIAEVKKKAEEEQQRQEEKHALESPSVPEANGGEAPFLSEPVSDETKDDMEEDESPPLPLDPAIVSNADDDALENGKTDEAMAISEAADVKANSNAPAKKLGFGLVGSGKRTSVPSVFHEEEDEDAQKDKKMRPLVPIDYSTEDIQAATANDEHPPAAESGKRVNPKEVKSDIEKERSRRSHDRSSHRERDRDADDTSRPPKILDAKQLIDMIPKTKDDLFTYEINWAVYDENRLHERMRPWISKKITEFLGEEETTLVEFIVDKLREHAKAEKMLDLLQQILDEEAEMFVLKMWRMLIFEIKRVETGLVARPGA